MSLNATPSMLVSVADMSLGKFVCTCNWKIANCWTLIDRDRYKPLTGHTVHTGHALAVNSINRKDYGIGTLHYNWPMSAHASQAFSTYTSGRDCTDSEHLPYKPHTSSM